jgi:hypothetical protein
MPRETRRPKLLTVQLNRRKRLTMGRVGYNVRCDFAVSGPEVKVTRAGQPVDVTFSTAEKDTKDSASALHKFLESIGRSRVDAHVVCEAV